MVSLFDLETPFQWNCPTCARDVVVSDESINRQSREMATQFSADDRVVGIDMVLLQCPGKDCGAPYVATRAQWGSYHRAHGYSKFRAETKIGTGEFVFAPATAAPLSAHVPRPVRDDYNEAYLIRTMSPKASATLSRRALQGMIRDRWGVTRHRLHDEILAIREHCDSDLYDAMMALKSIGNIGAHPEMDAAVIVDIQEGEAEELLKLLKLLDNEWYVARAKRLATIQAVKSLNEQKQADRKPA